MGCANADGGQGESSNAVTSVHSTATLNQGESNACWLFTTTGWAEALAGADKQYSPAYLDYWHWYEVFISNKRGDSLEGVGSWGIAAELIQKYGVTEQGWFVADDGVASNQALDGITKSLSSGVLSDKEKWNDRAAVRKELNRVFGVSSDVVAQLDQVFGADGAIPLDETSRGSAPIVFAAEIPITWTAQDGTSQQGTLADAIGTAKSPAEVDTRVGPAAWSPGPGGRGALERSSLQRVQRVLNAGMPVPASWFYATAARDNQWRFVAMPTATLDDQTSFGHMSLIIDYHVDNVPDFGTLLAGTPASDDAKEAALSDDATVVFFRTKDSYGVDPRQPIPGQDDVYISYLSSQYRVCPHGDRVQHPQQPIDPAAYGQTHGTMNSTAGETSPRVAWQHYARHRRRRGHVSLRHGSRRAPT
jgi:hypothetical protein